MAPICNRLRRNRSPALRNPIDGKDKLEAAQFWLADTLAARLQHAATTSAG
jgi:hypothetical protein